MLDTISSTREDKISRLYWPRYDNHIDPPWTACSSTIPQFCTQRLKHHLSEPNNRVTKPTHYYLRPHSKPPTPISCKGGKLPWSSLTSSLWVGGRGSCCCLRWCLPRGAKKYVGRNNDTTYWFRHVEVLNSQVEDTNTHAYIIHSSGATTGNITFDAQFTPLPLFLDKLKI
jgi:hypothetical protein